MITPETINAMLIQIKSLIGFSYPNGVTTSDEYDKFFIMALDKLNKLRDDSDLVLIINDIIAKVENKSKDNRKTYAIANNQLQYFNANVMVKLNEHIEEINKQTIKLLPIKTLNEPHFETKYEPIQFTKVSEVPMDVNKILNLSNSSCKLL